MFQYSQTKNMSRGGNLLIPPYCILLTCIKETGLSNNHKTTNCIMKSTFLELKPTETFYRNFRNFSNNLLRVHM